MTPTDEQIAKAAILALCSKIEEETRELETLLDRVIALSGQLEQAKSSLRIGYINYKVDIRQGIYIIRKLAKDASSPLPARAIEWMRQQGEAVKVDG
ncbi:MAG: hypothetical protein FWD69_10205 [Polyangiaceae bacterium]|nr:hypothetical protein [Polyangiaceae bacterium]